MQETLKYSETPDEVPLVLPSVGTIWDECGKNLIYRQNLIDHMNKIHRIDIHKCNLCSLVLKNFHSASEHIKREHVDEYVNNKEALLRYLTRITRDILNLVEYIPKKTKT